ncbi:allantoate amidohydrolase [Geodermatophilus sabuli]|uniref:N-carbamoyl-L-amino-acid hydrolase n=1 Tax=Geodermatophilus sabuli TaxID=1564158 RepID=A0A285EHX3_9ACTN|nr:allantoate amidohydrolase [Geodermatophilus sabuli]MBB3084038.1 N-carbamoyl-L-amino-acid hydrolase [Geodermatophilus sabuli]SNX98685.1 N-carbamoyl-L-amino-acid hydrolase [Geodermatophilus sabuli]
MTTFDAMWSDLRPVGRHPATGGYRRYAWTRTDAALREWFRGEARQRGLDVVPDRAGNTWAWTADPDAAADAGRPGLAMGSHLDSVPDGGAFDGPLGVVSAFAALDLVRARGRSPRRPLGIVCFGDEEGARFGVACAGSRLLTGALDPDRARGLTDDQGTTLAEAMTAAGTDPRPLGRDDEALRRVGTFLELHVEQGRALADVPGDRGAVGVAEGIWPHGRWRLDLRGRADHAGTTRLADRQDPTLPLAAAIQAARTAAQRHGALATVGRLRARPNAVNAIPAEITAWLDARGPAAADVHAVVACVAEAAGSTPVEESWTPATPFDPTLRDRLAAVLAGPDGRPAPVLSTGAGHDAGILSAAGVPTAMLFVRNPTGVSHSPAEHADPADCRAGVAALARAVEHLAC